MLRVLHLVGSAVDDEYADLSRLYARDAYSALADPARYRFGVAYVGPDGRWRFPVDVDTGPGPDGDAGADPLSDAALLGATSVSTDIAVARIARFAPDVVVPQMFCRPGMTSYRALFDVLGVAYIGNRPEVMAVGANKATAKAVVAAAGVRVPVGRLVTEVGAAPPCPVVVKPADADNSWGLTLVRDPARYPDAVRAALRHSSAALVETYVPAGREVRCGIVVRDGRTVALPLEEYPLDPSAPIRGSAAKLARGPDGALRLVAKTAARAWIVDPSDPITDAVHAAALRAHQALGCRHYSLFDFRVDPDGVPWFLEAGLYHSFARRSVLTVMAAAAGIALTDLFAEQAQHAALG